MGDFFYKTGVNAEKDIKNPGPGTKTERKCEENPGPGTKTERKYEDVQAQELNGIPNATKEKSWQESLSDYL